eukprot:354256-Chlamydomonas_euryale.AAC.5
MCARLRLEVPQFGVERIGMAFAERPVKLDEGIHSLCHACPLPTLARCCPARHRAVGVWQVIHSSHRLLRHGMQTDSAWIYLTCIPSLAT